jgi:hypothetical protein
MKILLILFFFLSLNATAQVTSDSSSINSPMRLSDFKAQKHVVSRGNVAIWVKNPLMTMEENQISDLESKEIEALIKRDTATLRKIWNRDFTLDEATNNLTITSNNPLPFYISLNRLVESLTNIESMISVNGKETYQLLSPNGKPGDVITRPFSHMWIQKNGEWKLLTKRH